MHTAQAVTRLRAGEHEPAMPPAAAPPRPPRPSVVEVSGGHSPADVLAAYQWRHHGRCFRCNSRASRLTLIATVRLPHPSGAAIVYELAMCGGCILREEERLELRAAARGETYEPGGVRPGRSGGERLPWGENREMILKRGPM